MSTRDSSSDRNRPGSGRFAARLMSSAALFILPALVGISLPTAAAQEANRVDAVRKGSLLVYPNVEVKWDSMGRVVADTIIEITNDSNNPVTIHAFMVNGDAPATFPAPEPGWNFIDFTLMLTSNQPTYFALSTGESGGGPAIPPIDSLDPGSPPGRPDPEGTGLRTIRGFIVLWAVDQTDREIDHDHLSGGALIVNHVQAGAVRYPAQAFRRLTGAVGDGVLNLDGVEYDQPFSSLRMEFFATDAAVAALPGHTLIARDTDLTLLPLGVDFRAEGAGPTLTRAEFVIWNENEDAFSGTRRCISCWDQTLLSQYDAPNNFHVGVLGTDAGRARIRGMSSVECPGSQTVPLLGVAAKVIMPDGGRPDPDGYTLPGEGVATAVIRYDPIEPERGAGRGATPVPATSPRASMTLKPAAPPDDESGLRGITDFAASPDPGTLEMGSLLVFADVEIRWNGAGVAVQDTVLTIANANNAAAVDLQVFFINGDPPTTSGEPGWNRVCSRIHLTESQPMKWSALSGSLTDMVDLPAFTHLDPGTPPGRPDPERPGQRMLRGAILAWAVAPPIGEISFNHLIGSAVFHDVQDRSTWGYNAYAFRALTAMPTGAATDGVPGRLLLDGVEYDAAPARVQLDFFAIPSVIPSVPGSPDFTVQNTDITLLALNLDLRAASSGPVTTNVVADIWNHNEDRFSGAARCLTCWDQVLLGDYMGPGGIGPNHFLFDNINTTKGKSRLTGVIAIACPNLLTPGDPGDTVVATGEPILGVAKHLITLSDDPAQLPLAVGVPLVLLGRDTATILYDPEVPGDFDADGDVDLDDYAVFAGCMAGPGTTPAPPPPMTAAECLDIFDFDEDLDVDAGDYSVLVVSCGW